MTHTKFLFNYLERFLIKECVWNGISGFESSGTSVVGHALELRCTFVLMVNQYSTYQYIYVDTEEQDVKLWNKGVTIQDLTKNRHTVVLFELLGTTCSPESTYTVCTDTYCNIVHS